MIKINKPTYLISVYKDDADWVNPMYVITVANIDKNIIVYSTIQRTDEKRFENVLHSLVSETYIDSAIIFNNESMSLTRFLIENYKNKLVVNNTMLERRIFGWTPSKSNLDSFYLTDEQKTMFKESFGSINHYLDKTHGKI